MQLKVALCLNPTALMDDEKSESRGHRTAMQSKEMLNQGDKKDIQK